MKVIPSINETNFEEIKKKLQILESWGAEWAHIDVSDGKFTSGATWNNPKDLKPLTLNLKPNAGIHLMVEDPDEVLKNWLDVGTKRIYVHYEVAADVVVMKRQCEEAGVELGLAVGPNVPVEGLFEFKNKIRYFLILAVEPGPSGQETLGGQLDKVKNLRREIPKAEIIFDGGVNPNNLFEIKSAGANTVVSGSYIWKSKSPKAAYQNLTDLA